MIIQSADESVWNDYGELANPESLTLNGAVRREIKTSSSELADQLGASTQTANRRLQNLGDAGPIYRQSAPNGQYFFVTEEGGAALWDEYAGF